MAGIELVTGPTIEPVTAGDLVDQVRVDVNDELPLMTGYIQAAREHVEQSLLSRAMLTQTWALWLDEWPADGRIRLPYAAPLQSVTNVLYYDEDDTEYTLSTDIYFVNGASRPAEIRRRKNEIWPATTLRTVNGIKVTYVAGYASAASVPQRWKQAILLLAADLYENREDTLVAQGVTVVNVPHGVQALLRNDRVRRF